MDIPITEGKIMRDQVSFKARNSPYSRTVKGDQIKLEPKINFGFRMPPSPEAPAGTRPAIGPPSDGSAPSIGTSWRCPAPPFPSFYVGSSGKATGLQKCGPGSDGEAASPCYGLEAVPIAMPSRCWQASFSRKASTPASIRLALSAQKAARKFPV